MPLPQAVLVTAPSRLHFGLLSFGDRTARQYGGAGIMVDAPQLRLLATARDELSAAGPAAERALAFAQLFADRAGISAACHLEILAAPPEHAGLGSGTQLGLGVAAALAALAGRADWPAAELARLIGRGERSAIGTHGFMHGGLLVEGGKFSGEAISPLISRLELPGDWRFVIVIDPNESGLSGAAERQAFAKLPPVPAAATAELCRELLLNLLPAAASGNFEGFEESLYRYGHQAGMFFAKAQGGAYSSPRAQAMVDWARAQGVRGVGQSSWGPSVFALLPERSAAEQFAAAVRKQFSDLALSTIVAAPDNHGARVEVR